MRLTFTLKNILLTLLIVSAVSWGKAQTASTSPNEVFKIAYSAYQMGNYELALKNYNLAITIDPSRNYFYYNRGLTFKALGNIGRALADFRMSTEFKPTAEAFYQIGLMSYEKNDLDAALAEFEKARELKEDLERMNFYMGMIYYRNNRFEDAAKCFYTYTQHVKNFPDAYYYRGLCEAKVGKYAEAITSFKFAMMYKNNDWKLYYKMYEIYLAMNDKNNALYSISMVIELGEKKPEHYDERARLYLDTGDMQRYDDDVQTAKEIRQATASVVK
ncbi:MAG: tetratricopeptide repeat protein [Chitinophagales bacterium]|nr:tetratricopeptide repeat protein [Chitinophagales bacterium]